MYNLSFLKIFFTFFVFLLKKTAIYGIINMNLLYGGYQMREYEKFWCEYVILGCPCRSSAFFINFLIKNGVRPTVYAQRAPIIPRLLGLARFCISPKITRFEVAFDILLRHADCHSSKKSVLIYTSDFEDFVQCYRAKLEKNFLVLNSEEIYEA